MKSIKISIICCLMGLFCSTSFCQSKVYDISWETDGPLLGASGLTWALSYHLRSRTLAPTASEILALNSSTISALDRSAIDNYKVQAQGVSDVLLYGSLTMPLLACVTTNHGSEIPAIGVMLFEGFFINDAITNFFKTGVQRYRPFAYNENVPLETKLDPNVRYSFLSGHTSMTAMLSVFSAKIITDFHGDLKFKPLVWGVALAIPAATGYLRYKAGKHFPTDIVAGYALGAAVGYMIPEFHKKENVSFGLGGAGVALNVRF